ncbi:EAL domain-containing protein [Methylobacillus flagellatus]|uniref:Diguanylate cyclase/phosphodiesterase n=1 Tax=Methylobacillus flagellatus (strain ATCC 51484 / DSM 6875 / VKM B-1610 / KT) TaxID=265072 RepID=Q1H1I1_METFK|nr:EAL domain-containing protein [Methylobacillus flagellatus]ABE49656.1 diguanylate cyclase/phosphodiesterase [Methylobacillus flagellatus KT]
MQLHIKLPNRPLPPVLETHVSQSAAPVVLAFSCRDDEELLHTLDKLSRQYTEPVLEEAYAWYGPEGNQNIEVLMSGVMPFNTFYARKRHPWLLDDLSLYVEMHFQPIVDFTQNGKIFGYEALCRLRDPGGNLLNGEDAFRLARQVNRAVELDLVCQDLALAGKARAIPDGAPLFINVLPQTIMREGWLSAMLKAIDRHGIDHRDVVIEVVESEDVSPRLLAKHCDVIRTQGLRIALDDMGSGFNGLSTLAVVKADFIKIDRAIVHEAQGSRVRTVLLEAIVSMAQRLGCTIVAEGLERVEDITYCQDLGLMYAQGFYFAKPEAVPAQMVTALPARDESHRSIPDEFRINEFVSRGVTVEVNTPIDQARRIFIENPDLACAVVLDNLRPIGLLKRGKVFTHRNDALGNYCDPLPRMITTRMPSSALARGLYLERGEIEPWIMVSEDGVYIGIVHPLEIMSQIISRKTSSGNLHPLSHLTTGPTLRQSLDISLRNNPSTQLVYIDLDHFKAYNDRYGFIRGDAMIRLLSEIVRQEFNHRAGVLVGHIGGDDFVLILDHEDPGLVDLLLKVVSHFQALAVHLYDSSDLERGFFTTEDGKDHPVASVSIAVVNGSQGRISNSVAAAERAATLKKIGKSNIGSIIVVESDPPQLVIPRSDEYINWQSRALNALKILQTMPRSADAHCLDSCFADYPFFEVIFELNPDGSQRFANWINPNMYGRIKAGGAGADRSLQAYYTAVRDSLNPYISSIYLSTATEDFCLTVSLPLFDADGRLSSILVADINIAAMAMLSGLPAEAEAPRLASADAA